MKHIISWTSLIIINTLMLGGLYAWQVHGIEPAGNAVIFYGWFAGVCGLLSAFISATKPIEPRGRVRTAAGWVCSALMVLSFAAISHFALATFYLLGAVGCKVWRDRYDADGNPIPESAAQES